MFQPNWIQILDKDEPLFHAPKIWNVSRKWVWPIRISLYVCAGYFLNQAYDIYSSGIYHSQRYSYSVDESPISWGVMLVLNAAVFIAAVWQSFRVKPKT
jgi:hypothetical protein